MRLICTVLRRMAIPLCIAITLATGLTGCDRQSTAGQQAEEAAERLGDELGNILNEAN